MLVLSVSVLLANLAEVQVIPVEAAQRKRLRFDQPVRCVQLKPTAKNPTGRFRVQCDDKTNPPEERGLGRVMCLIEVAPAVPMEFIELRVSLSAEGVLEVFES